MTRRGVTLLELLIVVAIVAPLTITILAALGHSRTTRGAAADSLAGLTAAQEALDSARIQAQTSRLGLEARETTRSIVVRQATRALLTETVVPHAASGMSELSIEVTFPENPEGQKPVRLTTLISRAGNSPVPASEVLP